MSRSSPKPSRKPPLHLDIERKLHSRKPHEYAKHIIAGVRSGNRMWWLHATKGWRTESVR